MDESIHEFYHDISNHIAPPTTDAGTGTKRGRRQPLGDFADSIGSIDARAVDKRFKEPNQIIGKNSGMGRRACGVPAPTRKPAREEEKVREEEELAPNLSA